LTNGFLPLTATVKYPNGQVVRPPVTSSVGGTGTFTRSDPNGNTITANATNGQINYIVDTLGTQPITSSGAPPNPVYYRYTAPSGAQASVTITYSTKTVQSAWGCSGVAEQPATSKNLIDRITLPDGT